MYHHHAQTCFTDLITIEGICASASKMGHGRGAVLAGSAMPSLICNAKTGTCTCVSPHSLKAKAKAASMLLFSQFTQFRPMPWLFRMVLR